MSKYKNTFIVVGVTVILLVLFAVPRMSDPNRGLSAKWQEAGLDCMSNGHSNVLMHFHPRLSISVDGVSESIPANIGITNTCMSELHTHDGTGTIHAESVSGEKKFYLKDFMTVYGQVLARSGYDVVMKVDGKLNTQLGELELKDKQQIELIYTKAAQ